MMRVKNVRRQTEQTNSIFACVRVLLRREAENGGAPAPHKNKKREGLGTRRTPHLITAHGKL